MSERMSDERLAKWINEARTQLLRVNMKTQEPTDATEKCLDEIDLRAEIQECKDSKLSMWQSYEKAIDEWKAEVARLRQQYNELIYAVARKYENETRHETALRYIREREQEPHGDDALRGEAVRGEEGGE